MFPVDSSSGHHRGTMPRSRGRGTFCGMAIVSAAPEAVEWRDALAGPVRKIAGELRDVIDAHPGEVHEIVYHGALGYGTSHSGFDRILYLTAIGDRVNLGFFFGATLADPAGLLQGTGKRMRHVKVTTVDEARGAGLRRLVHQALDEGPEHVAGLHRRRSRR